MRTCLLSAAALLLLSGPTAGAIRIWTIGDSTMANKDLWGGNEERGWGQMLPSCFDAEVEVHNHAVNGRSSRSFLTEGRWAVVRDSLRKGDYVLIQFGHNDEKADTARHTDPGTTYNANLTLFVRQARDKGAIPIICNSIVRRNFMRVPDAVAQDDHSGKSSVAAVETDTLFETHGAYLGAARDVATATKAPFLDMNRATHDWVQSLGPVASRRFFMWSPEGRVAKYPKGKSDNTHLNVAGARHVASLAADLLCEAIPELKPHRELWDIVVSKNGSGDFFTLGSAVAALPTYNKGRQLRLLVKAGEYREKVTVPPGCNNVLLQGRGEARVVWGDFSGKADGYGGKMGTSSSATFLLHAEGWEVRDMTFVNNAGPVGQAVAALIDASATFRRCRFLGNQDTLYTYGQDTRQLYEECYIEGTVDFVFGKATCYFDHCELRSLRSKGYVCAPATPEGHAHGYVFDHCRLTSAPGVEGCLLARPWRPHAQCVFVNCHLGSHIAPAGWDNWRNPDNEKTAYFGELASEGPGANAKLRAPWSHQLGKEDRTKYAKNKVLGE